MKLRFKRLPFLISVLFVIVHVVLMLDIPFLSIEFGTDYCGMGFSILMFFLVYPALSIAVGIASAIDIKYLWWMPLVSAAIFPPLFSLAMNDFIIWDLYFYSIFYVLIGYAIAGLSLLVRFVMKRINCRRKTEQ